MKKYSLLLFLLVSGALFLLVHVLLGHRNTAEEKEVANSNALRREHGVPIIENHWIKESMTDNREKWHDGVRGINSSAPVHLYKEILRNAEQIDCERDAFHYEFSDTVQYRLILCHRYSGSLIERTKNELIIYEPGKYPPSHSKDLTRERADSVLYEWKVKL